jgi:hypothetical protein
MRANSFGSGSVRVANHLHELIARFACHSVVSNYHLMSVKQNYLVFLVISPQVNPACSD